MTRSDWHAANRRYLMAALGVVRATLAEDAAGMEQARAACEEAERELSGPAALHLVEDAFGLSGFERDVLLMCIGQDLDLSFVEVCPQPTFGTALAALPGAHWSALTPEAPLRRWRLIALGDGPALTARPLRAAESVLHTLAGAPSLDARLHGIAAPLPPADSLTPTHCRAAERAAHAINATKEGHLPSVVHLAGADPAARQEVAAAACDSLGALLYALDARDIPTDPEERAGLARLWERDARLLGSALLIECDRLPPDRLATLNAFLRQLDAWVLLSAPDLLPLDSRRTLLRLPLDSPPPVEQAALWHETLRTAAPGINGYTRALIGQFNLSAPAIRAASADALARLEGIGDPTDETVREALWDACRVQARPQLDDLAQRIEPAAEWDDLVLPAAGKQTLREIAAQVRGRYTVYEEWGFAEKSRRGLGISALFAGPSGTGKTMAAEVLAGALRLDLYRIDLSSVVSKYIGETEKNLRRIFDAAEVGGAILLFDEADALFGRRSEVKDSHDRYANIEVSYLLQRMESYRGLAILTTNMKDALDAAFMRRLRFVVEFPFPAAAARAEIWRGIFPAGVPTDGLKIDRLARLNVAGGNIRNIALGAAFLAADEDQPVQMRHVLRAAHTEYAKLDRPLTDSEIKGWV
jgi:hypothetical protein